MSRQAIGGARQKIYCATAMQKRSRRAERCGHAWSRVIMSMSHHHLHCFLLEVLSTNFTHWKQFAPSYFHSTIRAHRPFPFIERCNSSSTVGTFTPGISICRKRTMQFTVLLRRGCIPSPCESVTYMITGAATSDVSFVRHHYQTRLAAIIP
jgi:hypothetical protein